MTSPQSDVPLCDDDVLRLRVILARVEQALTESGEAMTDNAVELLAGSCDELRYLLRSRVRTGSASTQANA